MPKMRIVLALVALCLALAIAACSDDSSSDNSSADGGSAAASTTEDASADSSEGGPTTDLPKKTIGFVNIIAASETAGRNQEVFEKAANALGWDVKTCDGAGDPGKMAACEQQLVAANVDAIVNLAISPSVVKAGAEAAKAKGIPVLGVGSMEPLQPPVYDALYGENDFALPALTAKYVVERLGPEGGEVAMLTSSGAFALSAASKLGEQMLTSYPNVKVVAKHETDLASVGPDTQKAVTDILNAHPKLNAIWTIYDGAFPPAVQTVKSRGFADKVFVVGDYATPTNVKLLEAGPPAAALGNTWSEQSMWVALDQLASHFAKDTDIDPSASSQFAEPLALITKEGLGELDSVGSPQPPQDFRGEFIDRWNQLYGIDETDPNSF